MNNHHFENSFLITIEVWVKFRMYLLQSVIHLEQMYEIAQPVYHFANNHIKHDHKPLIKKSIWQK